jgi:hypothetical protein
MKQIVLFSMLALVLAGCSPSAEVKDYPVLPEALKDCKFFRLTDANGSAITVARCPNSTTTTRYEDKAHTTTVIIDGKEYAPK